MDWRKIPSLAALRAFEALARQGSFSAAARELNVTHAAIVQHVRGLEQHFSQSLAVRHGQAMQLTEAGHTLAAALSDGFETIAEGVSALSEQQLNRPVNVTLTPAFAEAWLMPRIGAFWNDHPDISVALNPSSMLVDLKRDQFDLGIRFGNGNWPDLEVEPLDFSPFAVFCAPSHPAAKGPADLSHLTGYKWFFSFGGKEQKYWGNSIGLEIEDVDITDLPNNTMVLSAVRAGYGLSIQSLALVRQEIERGDLVVLQKGDPVGLGYHIIYRKGFLTPGARTFRDWLRKMARLEDSARAALGKNAL